ncbi:Protein maternal effect lethal 26 like protein [Argiope bruennichi]|uniref:Protein maternal effect lethal 26 like protein n=1 Tax=Argiope bruennichi TaxID=94029 RepID=A0A8T0EI82_ARGBR|nr:Protein maternal effect lethal 26 like protein [Argiope bruennichi]
MAGIAINEDRKRAHFTLIWTIKNAPRGALKRSRTFTVQLMEMTEWKLILIKKDRRIFICIERAGEDGGPKSLEIEFELSFLDTNGSPLVQTSCTTDFQNHTSSKWFEFPETDVVTKQKRDKFCPKVTLTIRCRIWRTRTEISKSELCFAATRFDVHKRSYLWAVEGFSSLQLGEMRTRTLNPTTEGCPELILTLSLARNDGKECLFIGIKASESIYGHDIDAEIAVINNEGMCFLYKRHSIFIIRSSVFEAMFAKSGSDKSNKSIDIPDMDADTLNRLLLYIYEDKVQDLTEDTAANLFVAADRYELLDLKEKCSNFLKLNITESNACGILVLADVHQDESLRKSVQKFILNNSDIIRYLRLGEKFQDSCIN